MLEAHKITAAHALNVQEKIIEKTQSEETLSKVSDNIATMHKSNNETQENLNKSNNGLFEKLSIGAIGLTIGAVAGFLFSKK